MEIAIFSATIAFLAAMTAQWLSHRFAIKRETTKYNNEVIQEFVIPNLNEVLLYIETETAFRKQHDVEVELLPEKIIENIKHSIKYADEYIINSLFDYENSITYFDGRGERTNIEISRAFYLFLDYSLAALQKSSFENEYLIDKISRGLKLYGISSVLIDLVGKENTISLLMYNWAWRNDAFKRIPKHSLDALIKDNYNDKKLNNSAHEKLKLLNIIENEFRNSVVNDAEFIFEILNEAREAPLIHLI